MHPRASGQDGSVQDSTDGSEVSSLLSTKKFQQFKETLEERISQFERVLANAEEETRANSARQADSADQAAAEYERQTLAHKADMAGQTISNLNEALKRIAPVFVSSSDNLQCSAQLICSVLAPVGMGHDVSCPTWLC
jgi:hypothetical protein